MELLSQSTDDHFHEAAIRWPFGISKVDKGLIPKNGDPCPVSFKNRAGHRDEVQSPPEVFCFLLTRFQYSVMGGRRMHVGTRWRSWGILTFSNCGTKTPLPQT